MSNTWRRFLLSGAFNTVVTYLLYLLLIQFLTYSVSYTIAFIAGIILSYCLNCRYVFQVKGKASTVALFPMVYLFQFLVGLGIVMIWVDVLGWAKSIAPLASIACTVPLTYLLSRWVFTK